MNEVLLGLVVSLGLLLWSLTWFWARDWDFVGKHPANAVFGAVMVVAGIVALCTGSIVFVEGVIALSTGA